MFVLPKRLNQSAYRGLLSRYMWSPRQPSLGRTEIIDVKISCGVCGLELMHCCCCYLLVTSYFSRFCCRVSVQYHLKCFTENFPCPYVALAAPNTKKDRVNGTLNRFDGLPAPKHIVLIGHNILQHSPIITKTLLQFARENSITCIILCTSSFILCIGCFSVIE